MFFGVFIIDVAHSTQLVVKLKRFAEENEVVIRYENLKAHIRSLQEKNAQKYHFFRPFHTPRSLLEHLQDRLDEVRADHTFPADRIFSVRKRMRDRKR